MRAFLILLRKELRSYFFSPMAYVLMSLFVFLAGWIFMFFVKAMNGQVVPKSLVFNLFTTPWFLIPAFFIFPLITMRLFAEERKLGTIEGLFTAPIRTSAAVMAKYGAAVILYAALIAPVFLFFPLFQKITGQEAAFHGSAVWGAALVLLLVGMLNIAMGIFTSSLTANQLIAAMLCFVGIVLHYFLGMLHYFVSMPGSGWTGLLTYFSIDNHVRAFAEGLIDTRPIVYYLSSSAVLLALTHHVLEYRKWRA